MSQKEKSKNDIAWEALFEKYNILSHIEQDGKFVISASQIKEYREPRLMAKFDHDSNLPELFKKNGLAILPITRGDYVVSHFKAYQQFQASDKTISHVALPSHIQSIDVNSITSETIAINCAMASGILADFLEDEAMFSTVAGRMGSGEFEFNIQNSKLKQLSVVSVNNSQIEIDAAFEGVHYLSLIEAKRDISADFLIRQLYYPFRMWAPRVSKPVKPIFLVYSNGIFSLYEYKFEDASIYNSLVLVKHKNYSVEDTTIYLTDLLDIASQVQVIAEPDISFPQADSFERIINLCELLSVHDLSHSQITQEYDFTSRQTQYYTDASRYLGLVIKDTKTECDENHHTFRIIYYTLSPKGKKIMQQNYRQRQLAFCNAILEHRAFKETFDDYMHNGYMPKKQSIADIMENSKVYHIESRETYLRRASTIRHWINWMIGLTQESL